MRTDLSVEELSGLPGDRVLATLATYESDGTVRLSPVWWEWTEGGFNVVIADGDVKARHLKRDSRASLTIYDHEPPYRGVELRAKAALTLDGADEVEHRLAHKYLGATKATKWLESPDWVPLLVRLEPGELRIWDFSDEDL